MFLNGMRKVKDHVIKTIETNWISAHELTPGDLIERNQFSRYLVISVGEQYMSSKFLASDTSLCVNVTLLILGARLFELFHEQLPCYWKFVCLFSSKKKNYDVE